MGERKLPWGRIGLEVFAAWILLEQTWTVM